MEDPRRGLVSLADANWLSNAETQAVFAALSAGGFEARAVGGAVRNALLGEPVKDIDFAATAEPGDVIRLVENVGLKAIPTGLEHGTITVVVNHVPFEVTTLRRDIETFGRHARVTYTTDWAEDARRRDFTINALYCDAKGRIHDPLGGICDIQDRRVRFIGHPQDRIREDYLRILRFFRFTAQYAAGVPDKAGLAACQELAAGLASLSGERIRNELLRLLAAPHATTVVEIMEEAGLFWPLLGAPCSPSTLARAVAIERALERPADPLFRLGALTLAGPGAALGLRNKLKLSSREFERLAAMALPDPAFDPERPRQSAEAFIYRHGAQRFMDGACLAWARSSAGTSDEARLARVRFAASFKAPELPVRGSDVLALGVPAGPLVGRIISGFEDWWIENGFPMEPQQLADELRRRVMVTKP